LLETVDQLAVGGPEAPPSLPPTVRESLERGFQPAGGPNW
jgi:hypothetical protein